ncbi:DNA-binding transcriptional regulator, AcrR family [Terrimicrobium sacchariphilum]|uniref:DNA-binding transcriptional regulator, AcrR family n=1 Tax=Terrimicrobium sacchariphilum TaxID=690879 RepID=A0A146G3T5_TERSA|nr:TetR/AcrR family transcriptional regulator [Terrimicrobium sacchariphilum]GAT32133.1 DNA-binding transcriptional regulator, AcrR family [Terrimicrobium sacchariphilum]
MKPTSTRDRILEEADRLFYERGYEHTAFADIAEAVGISRGNVTFHYQTKDAILDAVIDRRLARTAALLEHWEAGGEGPAARIKSFIDILIANRAKIMLHGCPVGTLCAELAKLEHDALSHASALFTLFKGWLATQFAALGLKKEADALALHLLARSQGIATLASALRDEAFLREEVRALHDWLDGIASPSPRRRRA